MRGRGVLLAFIVVALAATALPGAPAAVAADSPEPVKVQLLGLNDFHGHLQADTPGTIRETASSTAVRAGGAEYLATHVRSLEATNPNTMVVSAGDLIGASPLLSALFHDEPTIEAMNKLGLDLNAVGNHEFDEGADELRRMQEGGCHPVDGCQDGDGFAGAEFGFLAANVVDSDTGEPFFPPYAIRKFDGIKIGFIGMTLEGTPEIVSRSGIQGLSFLDEADTANRYAEELRHEHGVRAIVVLLHEGGVQASPFGVDTCNGISGPIVNIVHRTTPAVDLFVTGHTHQPYRCVIDGRPVTSASSFGRLVTDIDLKLDRVTKDVVDVTTDNVIMTQDVPKAADMSLLIAHYDAIAAPLRNRVIGSITEDITRTTDDSGESAMGNVIADAQLEATSSPSTGGAVAAFMNPGGVRADLRYDQISGTEAPGEVTYGEAFTVQPFGNSLVTMTLTGAQVRELLKQQWCAQTDRPRILLPSDGVTYTWDASVAASALGSGCAGTENPVSDLRIGGVLVNDAASYRVTVNSFLADGGDRFSVLRDGTDRTGGDLDLDALEAYFAAHSPVPPAPQDRITRVD